MATFKKDSVVKLIQPVIQGIVVERLIVEDEDAYRVQWIDAAGENQERVFTEDQIEAA